MHAIPLSTLQLFNDMQAELELDWLSGEQSGDREIVRSKAIEGDASLLGYLNLIHHNQIQIIGHTENEYLTALTPTLRTETFKQLCIQAPLIIVVGEAQTLPPELSQVCENQQTALMRSPLSSYELISRLRYYLTERLAEQTTLHGVFMEVLGCGVLLTGDSSVGKSELALELISRGHRLVADDAPDFSRVAPEILRGSCPALLQDFLEVRGLGILNIRAMFGDNAIKQSKYLKLIIHLQPLSHHQQSSDALERLHGTQRHRTILDVAIPEILIPVAPGRNLAILVETAVRHHLLLSKGYNPSEALIRKQKQYLEQPTS